MDYQKIAVTLLFRGLQGPVDHPGQVDLFGFLLQDLVRKDRPNLGVINKTA